MQAPYLLFLGDVTHPASAKTAAGIRQWRPERCAGQLRLPGCAVDLGLPDLSIEQAQAHGVKTMIIGVVNVGGYLPDHWIPALVQALESGLDLAAGLHQRLADIPELAAAAASHGRQIHDVRQPRRTFSPGSGDRRSGKRLLTIGTDCVVGKKYTALALERAMHQRGINADFRATGQTGILIAGDGVAVDAVIADFISGAAEWLAPANTEDHWDVIEGQGALCHPAYAGVTLGLMHGSQPDALVLCHQPTRTHLLGLNYPVPELLPYIETNLAAARLTNPAAQIVGISLNTVGLDDQEANQWRDRITQETGLPSCDPIRHGVMPILDHMSMLGLLPPPASPTA